MAALLNTIKHLLRDVGLFAQHAGGTTLRAYQLPVARAIVDSVINSRGHTIVIMFPRQSGKNELQGHVEAYLLLITSQLSGEIVKASPTWRPQSLNAMRRLGSVLAKNLLTKDRFKKREGYIYQVGDDDASASHIYFFSGEPQANVVGATAKTLLECDEAQDVQIAKWDKDFAPMASSTNATKVFWGTAWTSRTLLARELRAAQDAQRIDGQRRVFVMTADDVAAEVPAYGLFVAGQVAKLGRNHPLVRTQYFSEEIDADGGMFPPARRALLQGDHPPETAPTPGQIYALLIDVAGADEAVSEELQEHTGRDSTALTVVRIDLSSLADPLIARPTYRVVARRGWTAVPHRSLYGQLTAQIAHWRPRYLVIDATGVGEGLASFLTTAMPPGHLIPFVFSSASKTKLGWDLLSLVETGRLKDHAPSAEHVEADPARAEFWQQLEFVQYAAREHHALRWSVPNGTRDPRTGELVHDDWVLSIALAAILDDQTWGTAESAIIHPRDPLADLKPIW